MRIPYDPALPRLGVLLDPEAMASVLQRSLRRPARLDSLRIARVSYKPGERVLVHYEVRVDGEHLDAVARAVAGRDLAAKARRVQALELARRVSGRSPAATPVVHDADADAIVTWLPFDVRLPALAEAQHRLARRLAAAGVSVTTPAAKPRLLAYKPARRAVLRMGTHVLKIYGSARQFAAAAAGLEVASELSGVATPACEAVLASLRLTVQTAIDGAQASSLELAPEAGDMLRTLQQARHLLLEVVPAAAQLDVARRKAALIGTVIPALAPRVVSLVRLFERSAPGTSQLVPAHGDFHSGQLLRAGGVLHVLDFDSFCLADPALDLAEYAAGATEASSDTGAAVLDALVEAYGSRPDELDWHLAVALFVRASHPFQRAEPAWEDRVEELVGVAEAALAEQAVA